MVRDDRIGPGFLGIIELDLGAAALDAGQSRAADGHQLRALRLLEAAGFQYVTRRVIFNLAVADLDQLELERAEKRFSDLSDEDPDDPYIAGELARLFLAKGDLAKFRFQLRSFEEQVGAHDPRFAEALRLLNGVASLFNGELARAHGLLQRAGQEGEAWTGLVDTVAGREAGSWQPDGWGVSLAAELIHDAAGDRDRVAGLVESERMTRPRALAVALAERVGRARLPITEATRIAAVQMLRDGRMDGWAEALASSSLNERSVLEAVAEIVDRAGPEGLPPDLGKRLLIALGVGGLEVRGAVDGRLLWCLGSGVPGAEIRHGRVVVVPLGGEAHDAPVWRLLTGIFDLFAPAGPTPGETDIQETGFYGISPAARAVRRELCELGPTHLPILLVGETGVGKEVAARALHRLSGRRGAFVPVNVAAIPANLLEAELFGSVKGAFTGADRSRRGLTVAADGGTLFLDEIGDLDPPLQVKLLRFLEDHEVRAVGATQSKNVDVRIISATHQDLDRRVREGGFRQDLFYRVAAPPLVIPPLRERRQDILMLRDLFERDAINRHGLTPSAWSGEAEAMLKQHSWPGNVRELRQAVEVAMVRAAGSMVRPQHLPITEPASLPTGTWEEAQRDFRHRFLCAALQKNGGNRSATARELGISRQALLYHLRNLGIRDKGPR
jgi:transcriptional regulator with AAA-type ATPase domain